MADVVVADDNQEKPEAIDITKQLEEKAAELQAQFEEKYKSEIAGLNRRISEQDNLLKKAKQDKDASTKTLEDRVREIEEASRLKDTELARERLVRQLQSEAEKMQLVLDDELPMDKIGTMSLEEGVAFLTKRKELYERREKEAVNKILVNGHKPGGGSDGDNDSKKLPFDPQDMSPENRRKAEAYYAKQLEEGNKTE